MGRILARLDDLVPSAEYFDWLITPNAELGGRRPMDYVDADKLEPLEQVLDAMAERSESVNGSGHGSA